MNLSASYSIPYETIGYLNNIHIPYYEENKTSKELNANKVYESDLLTLDTPLEHNNPVLLTLKQLKELRSNWDGYGAIKPSAIAINRVELFLKLSPNSFIESLNQDTIYPNPNGTISIEWNNDADEIASLEIGDSNATFFAKFNDGKLILENNVDINNDGVNPEVMEAISQII